MCITVTPRDPFWLRSWDQIPAQTHPACVILSSHLPEPAAQPLGSGSLKPLPFRAAMKSKESVGKTELMSVGAGI